MSSRSSGLAGRPTGHVTTVATPDVLVLVLAGGAGKRLKLLTEHRAKAAVPFAGVYRLVDFPLSNCRHSGLADVWVATQFHPTSLAVHLANGRPWDLDRMTGGLMTLPPYRGTDREGWPVGTADVLWRNAGLVRERNPRALVVLSADAVYRLDYLEVVTAHLDHGGAATLVTTEVDPNDAGRYGVVQLRQGGRVDRYDHKPDEPQGTTVANEVFVFSPDAVLDRLEAAARADGEEALDDLGDSLLPGLAHDGEAWAYRHEAYWRDVGTVDAYWQAHQEFVQEDPPLDLDEPSWPVHTQGGRRSAARLLAGARVERSLLSGGTRVAGTVRGSVISPDVIVEAGATVEDSVLLPGVRVREGATVRRAVLDDDVVVGRGATVGGDGDVVLVGRAVEVAEGRTLAAGVRLPEPEDDAE
jgi:glucose-1-phosphate adenylyltransferase